MRYLSPLRYPGGKGRLAPYIARLISIQRPRPRQYAEPFAGGAGAALRLLVDEEVDTIHINDLHPGISAFWRCVFHDTERFIARIQTAEVSIAAWHEHSMTNANPAGKNDLELGFSTFFLNRCNRSGILSARPIGGLDQSGRWKIDARFNRESLTERVRHISQYRERVVLYEQDGRDFIKSLKSIGKDVLVYVDPPYLIQGDELYLDSLSAKDHAELARLLQKCKLPWFLTYDAHERITKELYTGLRTLEFDISHTAQVQHVGIEYAVFSDILNTPDDDAAMVRTPGRWLARSETA